MGLFPAQVQDPALALVEPHQVPLRPTFKPVQVTLNGSTAFWCIYHSSQFCVISKHAEGTTFPYVVNIDLCFHIFCTWKLLFCHLLPSSAEDLS